MYISAVQVDFIFQCTKQGLCTDWWLQPKLFSYGDLSAKVSKTVKVKGIQDDALYLKRSSKFTPCHA